MAAPRPVAALLVAPLVLAAAPGQPQNRAATVETALDRYVAAADPSFAWSEVRKLPAEGASATLLEMTSQRWLTEREVSQPAWKHWITVVRPAQVTSDIAFLFIGGGNNARQPPDRPTPWLVELAKETGTVTAELRLVPNQPLVFADDPEGKPRSEDDLIAYTLSRFLRTGDERWPALLPMTKSVVRAMDALTAHTAADGGTRVSRYVLSGGSKRGWTSWTTAAVDRRVVAIAPAVIDMLNTERSFTHHWRAYGAWSNAVRDYVEQGLMDWMGTPEFHALMKIQDPFEYRDRLTLPKLIVNASGDEFFLPDSSRLYFDQLQGEKHLRYVPNTSHTLEKSDARETLQSFYASVVSNRPRPQIRWTFHEDGALTVTATQAPTAAVLWQATNPSARNFRLDAIGPAYNSTLLTPVGPNTWRVAVAPPDKGWTAHFVELTFPTAGRYPLKLTTAVRVLPETLPFAAPTPARRGGEASAHRHASRLGAPRTPNPGPAKEQVSCCR